MNKIKYNITGVNMTGEFALKATEAQMDKAEKALSNYLSANPLVQVDRNHPEVVHIEVESDHDYIRESFGNFLEKTVEEVSETESDDYSVIKSLYLNFFNAMPEISVKSVDLESLFLPKG